MSNIDWNKAPIWAEEMASHGKSMFWVASLSDGGCKLQAVDKGSPILITGDSAMARGLVYVDKRPDELGLLKIITPAEHDEVQNPVHYDLFEGQQAIDVIRASLTSEEFAGYCKGNFLKYRLRAGEKGDPLRCLAKADWYRDYLRSVEND